MAQLFVLIYAMLDQLANDAFFLPFSLCFPPLFQAFQYNLYVPLNRIAVSKVFSALLGGTLNFQCVFSLKTWQGIKAFYQDQRSKCEQLFLRVRASSGVQRAVSRGKLPKIFCQQEYPCQRRTSPGQSCRRRHMVTRQTTNHRQSPQSGAANFLFPSFWSGSVRART